MLLLLTFEGEFCNESSYYLRQPNFYTLSRWIFLATTRCIRIFLNIAYILFLLFVSLDIFLQQLFFFSLFYMYCDRFITKTKIFTSLLKNLVRFHVCACKVIRIAQLVPMSLIMFGFYHFI